MPNNPYVSIRAYPDTERSVTGPFSGISQNLGTALTVNPVMMVMDNQSDVQVALYWNGILWHTFTAGEALTIGFKSEMGQAATFCPAIGDQFAVIATAGTGSFRISIIYAL